MLFLRRTADQSITFIRDRKVLGKIRDRKVLGKITFLRVDPDADQIDIEVDWDAPPAQAQHTLNPGKEIHFLEGILTFKFSFILRYDRYPPAASVGIEAPRSIAIYRSERLTGLGPDQIASLCKK